MNPEDARQQFLLSMYDQMWNNMNRHINLIWQPITVIFTVIASIFVAESQNLNMSIIFVIIFFGFLVIGWFLAHVYDSSHWYNRNLVIATNIEKQFLRDSDTKEILYFFKDPHIKSDSIITHFKIQLNLGIGLGIVLAIYYLVKIFQNNLGFCNFLIYLPLIGLIISGIYVYQLRQNRINALADLISKSPGKQF